MKRGLVVLLGGLLILQDLPAWADRGMEKTAQFLSDATVPLVAAGIAGLYLSGSERDQEKSRQILRAEIVSLGITEGLKRLTREQRPDGTDRQSFPSGHASSAFTLAEVLAENDRKHQGWYYGGAALIGWSRVELRKHYWWDVAAGAALGLYSARQVTGRFGQEVCFSLAGQDFKATLRGGLYPPDGFLLSLIW